MVFLNPQRLLRIRQTLLHLGTIHLPMKLMFQSRHSTSNSSTRLSRKIPFENSLTKSNNETRRLFSTLPLTEPFLDSQKPSTDIKLNWPKVPTEWQHSPSNNEIYLEEFMPITSSPSLLPDRTSQIFPVPVYSKQPQNLCDDLKKPPQ